MASIFSRIASGEIPSHKVAENDRFFAFLDINPVAKGHVLVVPKKEIDYIFDMETSEYAAFWEFAMEVARALKKAIPCIKVGIAVVGLEVPHAHIHLVPMNTMNDLNFSKPKLQPSSEELASTAALIAKEM
ncbi:MAG TPA: HIT family protein [Bacteroidales bacterium]|nr:HIT family protein [Bacteroidales bacterium]HPT02574.1 HIT family protein [Bacteroidales bacterium]